MASNLETYKNDLEKLISNGQSLFLSMFDECDLDVPDHVDKKKLPSFHLEYQTWYSESLAVVKQLIPHREDDFVELYKKPRNRKEISVENYSIEDYLQGLSMTRGDKVIVAPDAAISKFRQQREILRSAQSRFESSLFDMKQLLQADLFDSELDAATELNRKGFVRGAGAIAGVVLEGHLKEVCKNHKIQIKRRKPGISDLAEALKSEEVIDVSMMRKIQYLGDLRNLCDHKRESEPTKENVSGLIEGVSEVIKNLF